MPQREEIIQQALGLPPEDRALVAAALAYSLAAEAQECLPDSTEPAARATATGGELLRELQRRDHYGPGDHGNDLGFRVSRVLSDKWGEQAEVEKTPRRAEQSEADRRESTSLVVPPLGGARHVRSSAFRRCSGTSPS